MRQQSSKPESSRFESPKKAASVPKKNPAAVALGRLGGLKGGIARAAALSPAKRRAIAKKAALARWSRPKEPRKAKPEKS